MNRKRIELMFNSGDDEYAASILFDLYPGSRDDFEIEWVTDGDGERIENGEVLFRTEVQQAFEEHLINRPG
jgi:hypothetical protein